MFGSAAEFDPIEDERGLTGERFEQVALGQAEAVAGQTDGQTTGGVPALRCRSLARAAIIFSSTVRMFMSPFLDGTLEPPMSSAAARPA